MKILGVTACPSGVAHTYMSAEALQLACKKAGVECKVETQGSIGIENVLTQEDIDTADAIVLTTDMAIRNEERFAKLKKVRIGAVQLTEKADSIVAKIVSMLKDAK